MGGDFGNVHVSSGEPALVWWPRTAMLVIIFFKWHYLQITSNLLCFLKILKLRSQVNVAHYLVQI